MSFSLVPKILDSVYVVFLVSKQNRVVDPKMLKIRNVQGIIAAPTISINDTVWNNLLLNDRHKTFGRSIFDNFVLNFPPTFQKPKDRNFATSTSATFSFARPAKITFVKFDFSIKDFVSFLLDLKSDKLTKSLIIIRRRITMNSDNLGGTSRGWCRQQNARSIDLGFLRLKRLFLMAAL